MKMKKKTDFKHFWTPSLVIRFMKRGAYDSQSALLYAKLVKEGFGECDQIKKRLDKNRNKAISMIQ